MTTARDIIKKALQKNGALIKSESPDYDEAIDGLSALNALIASWSNDSLVIYARSWETFSITANVASYTIGTGGALNTSRPSNIVAAYTRSGGIDYPITIVDDESYNTITFKTAQGIPTFLNYDGGYPLGTVRMYPVPSAAYSLFLLTEKPLTEFASLDTELSMPAGTERALIYNLAIELAPEYNQQVTPSIEKIAAESLGLIRSKVAQVRGMDAFPRDITVRNIYSGYWN